MFDIAITNQQSREIGEERLRCAAEAALAAEGVASATVSIAVVDDATIHRLNQQYLEHDQPTDVLSFLLELTETTLEGEVIVSADTAAATAEQFGWTTDDELMLYVVHGMLHLLGYDDQSADEQTAMRARERDVLSRFGLRPRYAAVQADAAWSLPQHDPRWSDSL
jgi:probable rRNA maturation factor